MSTIKHTEPSVTLDNLQAALAGESMAHIKYLYFAQVSRELGDEYTAKAFEETAAQEVKHAIGHMNLLYPKESLSPQRCLELAIEGETYEYTEMYPKFRDSALEEQHQAAQQEFEEQIAESKEHADFFRKTLVTAHKRFAALAKVEKRHAEHYEEILLKAKA